MASLLQSHEYLDQQPMSLLRVGGLRPGVPTSSTLPQERKESDLLTIRILEASERKMRMIKELLSPEQFQSLSSDLFVTITPPQTANYQESETFPHRLKRGGHGTSFDGQPKSGPPFSKRVEFADKDEQRQNSSKQVKQQILSKSETNLSRSGDVSLPHELTKSQHNIQENLAKRRQAVEFFFSGYTAPAPAETLAIELRFGDYLRTNMGAEDKLIDHNLSGPVSGLGYLCSLLVGLYLTFSRLLSNIFGRTSETTNGDNDQPASPTDLFERQENQYRAKYKKFNNSPYSSGRNLATFISRIRRDKQLDKLIDLAHPVRAERPNKSATANEKLEKQLIFIKQSDSDLSFRLMSDLNRRVLALERGEPLSCCDLASESKFLIHHPLVARATRGLNKQHLGNSNNNRCRPPRGGGVNFGVVSLKLEGLKLVSHKSELQEEILARKLRDEFAGGYLEQLVEPLSKVVGGINDLATRISELTGAEQPPLKLMGRMFSLVEMRAKLLARISAKQRKLSMIWNELRATRDEQGFNYTTLVLDLSNYDDAHESPLGSLDKERLTQSLDHLCELTFAQEKSQDVASKHLKRWQKFVSAETSIVNKHLLLKVELLPEGLPQTSDQDCPQDELKRRLRLARWLGGSLGLKLIINDNFYFDLPAPPTPESAKISQDERGQRQVELANRTSGPIELKLSDSSKELKLKIVLFEQSNYSFLPAHLNRQLATRKIHEATFLVPMSELEHRSQRYELALKLAQSTEGDTGEEEGRATRLSLVVSLDFRASISGVNNSRLNTKLIDFLWSIVFDDGEKRRQNAFEDTQTKAGKLLNRVNARVLLTLMGKLDKRNLGAKFCLLDPHFRPFRTGGASEQQPTRFLPNVYPVTLRHALLVWRWITGAPNERNPIYLSERENHQTLTSVTLGSGAAQLLDDFKSRIKSKGAALKGQPEGYKSIEQTRALALDYIRQCELFINQIIGLNSTTSTSSDVNLEPKNVHGPRRRAWTTRDLLIEPQLKLMARPNLPSPGRVIRALLPRPTARRPLMPNRRLNPSVTGQSKFSQLVELSQVRRLRPARASKDLEGQALDQWRRFTDDRAHSMAKHGGNLRLVVTIRQASNVPFRLESQPAVTSGFLSRGYPTMRSSSPLFSPSPMIGPASPPPLSPIQASSQQQHFLEPATTYVEAVFQRQQLASSLAQGKNPAWNETLFFDVDHDASTSGTQQLADEFLHLNLYDCRAYINNDAFSQPQQLDVHSLLAQRMPQQQQQQQQMMAVPAAQHQRTERHLLGSLQVPMSVLLTTSGRIEGSFALSQPLLLEHAYQFDRSETTLVGARQVRVAHQPPARTSLSLFITLDPPVSLPTSLHLPTGSHERADLFEYARLWERIMLQVPARAGNRRRRGQQPGPMSGRTLACAEKTPHIRALVMRDDARYCLVCRFLAPLEPPKSLMQDASCAADQEYQDHQQAIMRRLARFVSLLSPLKHGHFQVRSLASSLWFSSRQLLHDALGGQEEKALLLCNFFLHLGKCASLLLADCIPDGRCIYVLVWSSSDQDAARTTSQLELQVSELMDTLGGGGGGDGGGGGSGMAANTRKLRQEQLPPVDATNFIARLPILIHSRACQIWDPKTGVCYRLTGSAARARPLPAMSVGSIVTPENVYANLQQQATPMNVAKSASPNSAQINFDIRQRNLWFPLFSAQAQPVSETGGGGGGGGESNVKTLVGRESRRILHVHNWRKQLAQLDQLSKMIGRPIVLSGLGSHTLEYGTFTHDQCRELRDFIERQIKSNLLIWRPTRPTYFNRTLSRIIEEKLASFERSILGEHNTDGNSQQLDVQDQGELFEALNNEDPSRWRAQLAELIRKEILDIPTLSVGSGTGGETRQVTSWPVNLAYSGTRVILDGLYASGVHNADLVLCGQQQLPLTDGDENIASISQNMSTQFLVACHVEPYPARTMSVWLYVGAIVSSMTGAR